MNNLTFNNIPDPNQNEEFRKSMERLQEISKKISEKCSPALLPLAQMAREMSQASEVVNNSFYVAMKEITSNIQTSEVIKTSQTALQLMSQKLAESLSNIKKNLDYDDFINQNVDLPNNNTVNKHSEDDIKEIEFTDEQLTHIENLNININVYSDNEKSTKNNKIFTISNLLGFVSVLISIIALLYSITSSEESAQQNETTIEIESKTNEILDSIYKQLSESTSDEADAQYNLLNNQ